MYNYNMLYVTYEFLQYTITEHLLCLAVYWLLKLPVSKSSSYKELSITICNGDNKEEKEDDDGHCHLLCNN